MLRRTIRIALAAIVLALAIPVVAPARAMAADCVINGGATQSCTCEAAVQEPAPAGGSTIWRAACRSFGYPYLIWSSRVGPNGPWRCISLSPPPPQPRPAPIPPVIPPPHIDPPEQRTDRFCYAAWTISVGAASTTDMLLSVSYGDGRPPDYFTIPQGPSTVAFHVHHVFPMAPGRAWFQRATVVDTGASSSSRTVHL